MKDNVAYDWNILPFYQPVEFFRALSEGKLPETFIPHSRYDEHLLESVIPIVFSMPPFRAFTVALKPTVCTAFRNGDDCPVIRTDYQLSIDEVRAMQADPDVFFKFMASMGNALANKSLPIEEVFACVMDAVFTSDYILGNTMHTVH